MPTNQEIVEQGIINVHSAAPELSEAEQTDVVTNMAIREIECDWSSGGDGDEFILIVKGKDAT